jgi:hypothetical protein
MVAGKSLGGWAALAPAAVKGIDPTTRPDPQQAQTLRIHQWVGMRAIDPVARQLPQFVVCVGSGMARCGQPRQIQMSCTCHFGFTQTR